MKLLAMCSYVSTIRLVLELNWTKNVQFGSIVLHMSLGAIQLHYWTELLLFMHSDSRVETKSKYRNISLQLVYSIPQTILALIPWKLDQPHDSTLDKKNRAEYFVCVWVYNNTCSQ